MKACVVDLKCECVRLVPEAEQEFPELLGVWGDRDRKARSARSEVGRTEVE
jgi:hypothetical protein